jgi:hypothetical protein
MLPGTPNSPLPKLPPPNVAPPNVAPLIRARRPPFMAIWLIRTWGSRRYRNDLVGDLIEQHVAGRSGAWCFRQAAWAVWLARVEAFRTSPWVAAIKALILALGMITLGASTLSWAESVPDEACPTAFCGAVAGDAPGR